MKFSRLVGVPLLLLAAASFLSCTESRNNAPASRSNVAPAAAPGPALAIREAASPVGADSREPEMSLAHDGRIILSWVEKLAEKHYALRFATRDAKGWSEARTVAEGRNWFVNWADFPSVIALADGTLAAHWLVKSGPKTYAYDVNLSLSKDGGKTWTTPIVPHTDGTQTEHGFVSLIPLADGRLGAAWVDGRNLKDIDTDDEEHGPLPASMTLRFAAVDQEGKLSDEAVLDDRVCECCQTSAAVTSEGVIVAYRDRSPSEVRDIYYVRRENGKWGEPRAIHEDGWEMTACPVNGPSIAADGRRVALAWYTEAQDKPRVQIAFSTDAGATFGKPVQVDDGQAVGRVDVLMLADGSALVCWLSGTMEKGAIKVRRVRADGTLDAVSTITETDLSRSSGFPRMAQLGDKAFFAWTQFGKPSRVRMAEATLETYK